MNIYQRRQFQLGTPPISLAIYVDEVFVKIRGTQHYLWRSIDRDGEAVTLAYRHYSTGGVGNVVLSPTGGVVHGSSWTYAARLRQLSLRNTQGD